MNTPHVSSLSSPQGQAPAAAREAWFTPAGWSLVSGDVAPGTGFHFSEVAQLRGELSSLLAASEQQQAELAERLEAASRQNNLLARELLAVRKLLGLTQEELATLRAESTHLDNQLREGLVLSQEQVQAHGRSLSALQGELHQIRGELEAVLSSAQIQQGELQRQQQSHNRDMAGFRQAQIALAEQVNEAEASASHVGAGLLLVCLLMLAAAAAAFIFLRKRVRAFRLEQEQHRADMLELISTRLAAASPDSAEAEPDHAPMLKFANEISRMEMNLARMDAAVKGHKQLTRGLERIRNNLAAAGYEMVPLLGQPYHEGMRVDADFVIDESLPAGERRITAVARPQVNYKGVLIQKASMTVSQNI